MKVAVAGARRASGPSAAEWIADSMIADSSSQQEQESKGKGAEKNSSTSTAAMHPMPRKLAPLRRQSIDYSTVDAPGKFAIGGTSTETLMANATLLANKAKCADNAEFSYPVVPAIDQVSAATVVAPLSSTNERPTAQRGVDNAGQSPNAPSYMRPLSKSKRKPRPAAPVFSADEQDAASRRNNKLQENNSNKKAASGDKGRSTASKGPRIAHNNGGQKTSSVETTSAKTEAPRGPSRPQKLTPLNSSSNSSARPINANSRNRTGSPLDRAPLKKKKKKAAPDSPKASDFGDLF